MVRRILKIILQLNVNTLRFNFTYFPFKQAISFPVLVSKYCYLKSIKGNVQIVEPIKFGMIKIGYECVDVFDYKKSRSILKIEGTLKFKGRAFIGQGSKISIQKGGVLELGRNFYVTAESSFIATKKIQFGDDCLVSWDVLFMDSDLHIIKNEKGEVVNHPKEIIIEDHVWIGCRALILKGSLVAKNTIIAANSNCSNKKLLFENAIYSGNPICKIKENINWN